MTTTVNDYYEHLTAEIASYCDSNASVTEIEGKSTLSQDAFFSLITEKHFSGTGELDGGDANRCFYRSKDKSVAIDGFSCNFEDFSNVLTLIIMDYSFEDKVASMSKQEASILFDRLQRYLTKSIQSGYGAKFESTTEEGQLAKNIAARWADIMQVRLILLTNRLLSRRETVNRLDGKSVDGRKVTVNVWDIRRLWELESSGRDHEDFEVDLEQEFGGPLEVLEATTSHAGYDGYLCVVPAVTLGAIYEKYTTRLLESNVRVFLQAKGGVNKGIRTTLTTTPTMFFAYNNGIASTAENVDVRGEKGSRFLYKMTNFQIVNGGQTTASVYNATKDESVDLKNVFVAMKLLVVKKSIAEDIVPKISKYANTQNKVKASDLQSHHPFYSRIESLSRSLFVPYQEGALTSSKWFYERTRGQYLDARLRCKIGAERKKFDIDYPSKQRFEKVQLAKYHILWMPDPVSISKGPEINFNEFTQLISDAWDKDKEQFDENYYRDIIARGIAWIEVRKLIQRQEWYQSGYLVALTAYTICKLVHDVNLGGDQINLDKIWRLQTLSDDLNHTFSVGAREIDNALSDKSSWDKFGGDLISEWAKRDQCWKYIKTLPVNWPKSLLKELV